MSEMNAAITRRQMAGRLAASMSLLCSCPSLFGADSHPRKKLGIGTYSYSLHWKAAREGNPKARFKNPLEFLEYCHDLGAGGVQVGLGAPDAGYTARLRARAEA